MTYFRFRPLREVQIWKLKQNADDNLPIIVVFYLITAFLRNFYLITAVLFNYSCFTYSEVKNKRPGSGVCGELFQENRKNKSTTSKFEQKMNL